MIEKGIEQQAKVHEQRYSLRYLCGLLLILAVWIIASYFMFRVVDKVDGDLIEATEELTEVKIVYDPNGLYSPNTNDDLKLEWVWHPPTCITLGTQQAQVCWEKRDDQGKLIVTFEGNFDPAAKIFFNHVVGNCPACPPCEEENRDDG